MDTLQLSLLRPVPGSGRLHVRDLPGKNIFKVPQVVYQAMYDVALLHQASPESKWKVMHLLEEWVQESYPGWAMVSSVELSLEEAREAERLVEGITFGIYVKIAPITKPLLD